MILAILAAFGIIYATMAAIVAATIYMARRNALYAIFSGAMWFVLLACCAAEYALAHWEVEP